MIDQQEELRKKKLRDNTDIRFETWDLFPLQNFWYEIEKATWGEKNETTILRG